MSEPREGRRTSAGEAIVAALVLALVHAALFAPQIAGGELHLPVRPGAVPPWWSPVPADGRPQDWAGTDKVVFNYPNVVRWTQEVRRDPAALLWNPYNFCGTPFLATQNTHVLYPLNAVYLVFGTERGLLVTAILHGWIASLLAWFALRRFGAGMGGALIGAVVYGGSGWFLVNQDRFQFVQAAAWIPLMILGATLAAREGRRGGVVALALGIALSFFGGMPQITLIGLLAAGVAALAGFFAAARERGARGAAAGAGLALAGVVFGFLLAAPQLLPTWEWSRESRRTRVVAPGMRPWELAEMVVPELLGNPPRFTAPDSPFGPGMSEAAFPPYRAAGLGPLGDTHIERCFYPGLVALLLAAAAVAGSARARVLVPLALAVAGILAAMGTPVFEAVKLVPGMEIGNKRRLVLLVPIGLALLAALGVATAADPQRRRRTLTVAGAVLAVPAALAAIAAAAPRLLMDAGSADGDALAGGVRAWVAGESLRALAFGAGFLAVVTLAPKLGRGLVAAALLALLAGDLAILNRHVNPGQAPEPVFPASRLSAWFGEKRGDLRSAPDHAGAGLARLVRFKSEATDVDAAKALPPALPPNLNMPFGIFDAQGYEALVDYHVEDVMDLVERGMAVEHHAIRELHERASLDSPLLDLMGVRWVLASGRLDLPLVFMDEQELVAVYENEGWFPRWQVPREVRIVGSEAEVLERLGDRAFDPRREAVVLAADAAALGLAADAGPAWANAGTPATFALRSWSPAEIRLDVRAASRTAVLWADAFHPEWTARLERGGEIPVARADHAFGMFVLPPGDDTLVLAFRPRSLWRGVAAAGVGAAALAALMLVRRRGTSRAKGADPEP